MKKHLLAAVLLISIIALSCTKKSNLNTSTNDDEVSTKTKLENLSINTCGITAITQLPWAEALVSGKGSCQFIDQSAKLTMYNYRGGQVFYFEDLASSVALCSKGLYNCAGVKIISFDGDASIWADFNANRTNPVVLWSK